MIGWALEALAGSAVLMALVLAAREPVRRAFGPRIAYALWVLPACRLLLPPLPEGWHRAAALPIARAGEQVVVLLAPAGTGAAAAPAVTGTDWLAVLAAAWVMGALALIGWQLVVHGRFCRRLLARGRSIGAVDGVPLVASPAAMGPLAFGVARRWIAVPLDWTDRFTPEERELVLAHERAHHRRGDLLANWAALGVLALHWFNPLAWIAFRAFRADQELATDACVLAGRRPAERADYAAAIVKAAAGGTIRSACALNTLNDLKRRLRMLTTSRPSRRRLAAGGASLSLLVAAGLGITASGATPARIVRGQVDRVLPPAPPEPPQPADGVAIPPAPPTAAVGDIKVWSGPRRSTVVVRAVPGAPVTTRVDGQVATANCGPGAGNTVRSDHAGSRVIVICQDRIDEQIRHATEVAANSATIERDARAQALAGLRHARETILANQKLAEAERVEALAPIEQAMAELQPGHD